MVNKLSKRQKRLATLLKATSGTISIDDAMHALNLSKHNATRLLADWHKQGVIRRVTHGLYVPIQPSAIDQIQVLEDPWILVPELYYPGYIGGWTALEHWGITEQMFRSICVLTNKKTSYGNIELQGVSFFIKYIPPKYLYGTKSVWRDHIKIQISDPHKTILDIIDKPELGAGLQHAFDCFKEYSLLFNSKEDRDQLLEYALKLNNGAVFKKLGFLAEQLSFGRNFLDVCHQHLTKGYATVDINLEQKKLVTRWRLWIPKSWAGYD